MKIGSLCTGYGGLDMALDGDTAWVSDIDKAACTLLAYRFPDVPNLGDLTAVDWASVEPVDIITGGFPCQPFSHAGQRKGTNDERHIWPHIARALGVLRPRYAFFENVPGLLSLGFADVLADLAKVRFDAQWVCVRAADVGAPHRRERVFILATNTGSQRLGQHSRESSTQETGPHSSDLTSDSDRGGFTGHRRAATPNADDTRRAQRGGTEPATARLTGAQHRGDAANTNSGRRAQQPQPDRNSSERLEPSQWHDAERPDTQWGAYAPAIARWEHLTGRIAPNPTEPNSRGKQRLSPRFVEWLMGLPGGWVTEVPGLSRTKQLELLGNGVVPQQARAALAVIA